MCAGCDSSAGGFRFTDPYTKSVTDAVLCSSAVVNAHSRHAMLCWGILHISTLENSSLKVGGHQSSDSTQGRRAAAVNPMFHVRPKLRTGQISASFIPKPDVRNVNTVLSVVDVPADE